MRTVVAVILLALLAAAGCGNKPPETKYDPDRKNMKTTRSRNRTPFRKQV